MLLQETILCATAPTSSNPGPGLIAIYDIQTGATLASFKQTNAGPHSIAVLESKNTQGGYILASQLEKSILNVYNFQKDQISLKMVLPEKLTAIAIDSRGDLCAGGTASGRIYIWETASGILYNSWDAHYRKVNVLRFTTDGAAVISGSDDSGVNVWSVSRLLDEEMQNEHLTPYCMLADHTLPVTDITCGIGVFPDSRILTSSLDHSVKLWDLSSKSLLSTFYFPQPISYLAWDATERLFFAASSDGSVHQMNMFQERELRSGGTMYKAVGGGGVTDVIRADDENQEAQKKRLISVGQSVTSLCLSMTSTILLVGTSNGLIHLYDVPSHQSLRSISNHKGVSIAHLQTMIKPPDLIGHITLFRTGGSGNLKDTIPVKPVMAFQRTRDPKIREAHEITTMLPGNSEVHSDLLLAYPTEELLRDQACFIEPSTSTGPEVTPVILNSKVMELEAELANMRELLGKAKGMNDAMWNTIVHKLVGSTNDREASPKASAVDGERSGKRGRVV